MLNVGSAAVKSGIGPGPHILDDLVDSFINGRVESRAFVVAGVVRALQQEGGVPDDSLDRCLDEKVPVLWIFVRKYGDAQCGGVDLVLDGFGSFSDSFDWDVTYLEQAACEEDGLIGAGVDCGEADSLGLLVWWKFSCSDQRKGFGGDALRVLDELHGVFNRGECESSFVAAYVGERDLSDRVVLVIGEDALGDDQLVGVNLERRRSASVT